MPRTVDRTADSLTLSEPLRRADPAHTMLSSEPAMLSPVRRGAPSQALQSSKAVVWPKDWDDTGEAEFATGETLLRLHATELIDRLQRWSCDLDARQSQLNLQSASQDQRERQFRLWSQARETELMQRLRAAEQQEKRLRESARRLALTELGNQR